MAKRSKLKSIPIYREDQNKCMSWCLNNGIKVYIIQGEEYIASDYRKKTVWKINPYKNGLVTLEVFNNGAVTKSDKMYTQDEANMKIWQIYCHFYDTNK